MQKNRMRTREKSNEFATHDVDNMFCEKEKVYECA